MEFEIKDQAPTPALVGYLHKEIAPYGDCLAAAVRYALQTLALMHSGGAFTWLVDDSGAINRDAVYDELVSDVLDVLLDNRLIVPEVEAVGESITPVLSNDFVKVVEDLISIELRMASMINEALTSIGLSSRLLPVLDLPLPLDVLFPVQGAA